MNRKLIKIRRSVDYDEEPVYYCKQCLSLRVMCVGGNPQMCFCDRCNAVTIGSTDIHTWMSMYKEKHGFDYVEL